MNAIASSYTLRSMSASCVTRSAFRSTNFAPFSVKYFSTVSSSGISPHPSSASSSSLNFAPPNDSAPSPSAPARVRSLDLRVSEISPSIAAVNPSSASARSLAISSISAPTAAISFSTRAFSASISAKSFSVSKPSDPNPKPSHPVASSPASFLFPVFSFGYRVSYDVPCTNPSNTAFGKRRWIPVNKNHVVSPLFAHTEIKINAPFLTLTTCVTRMSATSDAARYSCVRVTPPPAGWTMAWSHRTMSSSASRSATSRDS